MLCTLITKFILFTFCTHCCYSYAAAIQCLKRKRLYEQQIEQLGNFQLRIHDQVSLEFCYFLCFNCVLKAFFEFFAVSDDAILIGIYQLL